MESRAVFLSQGNQEQISDIICLEVFGFRQAFFVDKAAAHGGVPAAVSDIFQGCMQQVSGMNGRIF